MQYIIMISMYFLCAISVPLVSGFGTLFHIYCLIKMFESLANVKDFIFK